MSAAPWHGRSAAPLPAWVAELPVRERAIVAALFEVLDAREVDVDVDEDEEECRR